MAELDAATIIGYLNTIDTQIAALTANLGAGGAGGAAFVDYKIGAISISGSQRMKQLLEAREVYQKLLQNIPAVANDVVSYDVQRDGRDDSDLLGDE